MNLRSRLLAVAVAITALIAVLLIGIVMRQRAVLTDQVDDQLELVADAMIRRVGTPNDPPAQAPAGEPPQASTGDIYIADISPSDLLVVLAEPVSGPPITPDIDQARSIAQPMGDGPVEDGG